MHYWDEPFIKREFKKIIEKITACNICAVESQVLIENKKENRGDIIEALVVVLSLWMPIAVLCEYTVE